MSTSGGATWTKLDQTLREVIAVTVDPLCEAGSFGDYGDIRMAISTSTDGGTTWNRSVFGDGQIKALAVDAVNKKILYAGGTYLINNIGGAHGRLFKSTDGGITWGEIGASIFNSEGNCIYGIAVDPRNSGKVLACTWKGVYTSQDGGVTWIVPTQDTILCSSIVPDGAVAGKFYLGSIGSPHGPGSAGVWVSINGGSTWQQINNGVTNPVVQCIAYDTTNKVLYAGTAGAGVLRLFLEGKPANRKPIFAGRTPGTLLTVTVNTSTTFRVSASDPDGDAITYTWKVNGTTEKTGSDSTFTRTFSSPAGTLQNVTAVFADPGGLRDSTTWSFTTIAGTTSHGIILQQGWNIISSYVAPSDSTLDTLFVKVRPRLVIVKNAAGQVYWPAFGINGIGRWNYRQGYQLYMQGQDTLTISGLEINPQQTPVVLTQGWNIAAYVKNCPMRADSALTSLGSNLVIAKNAAGQVYWPAFGINSIGNMRPGQGYQMYVTNNATFTYPANPAAAPPGQLTKMQVLATNVTLEPRHYQSMISATGSDATVLIEGRAIANGDEVGVWTASGMLVGSGVVEGGSAVVTVWGGNPMTDVKDGAGESEALSLMLYSVATHTERSLRAFTTTDVLTRSSENGTLRYHRDGVYAVQLDELTSVAPTQFALFQNYPNPFNPSTTISYSLPKPARVSLRVFNTLGQEVASLMNGEKEAGTYQVTWNAASMPSGVYIYRLEAGEFVESKKLTLLK